MSRNSFRNRFAAQLISEQSALSQDKSQETFQFMDSVITTSVNMTTGSPLQGYISEKNLHSYITRLTPRKS